MPQPILLQLRNDLYEDIKAVNALAGEQKVIFTTSFSKEDQIITDAIFSLVPGNHIEVVTLDTGRLFPETYTTWWSTEQRYNTRIRSFVPDTEDLEQFLSDHGVNPFYQSIGLRRQCCHVRKVAPLRRALKSARLWITGIRSAHSDQRQDLPLLHWDETHSLYKYNPLIDWTDEAVDTVIRNKSIPCNPLHDKGFVSIGCAPCTRAIRKGENFRAGRWWWEDQNQKECGLHQ